MSFSMDSELRNIPLVARIDNLVAPLKWQIETFAGDRHRLPYSQNYRDSVRVWLIHHHRRDL
jgi:hypothetical protein